MGLSRWPNLSSMDDVWNGRANRLYYLSVSVQYLKHGEKKKKTIYLARPSISKPKLKKAIPFIYVRHCQNYWAKKKGWDWCQTERGAYTLGSFIILELRRAGIRFTWSADNRCYKASSI